MSVLRSWGLAATTLFWSGCLGSLTYYGDPGNEPDGATDPLQGNETTVPEPLADLSISQITPDFGSNGGGQLVRLVGDLDGLTEVVIDGEPATVVSGGPTEVEILTPTLPGTIGPVDVEVRGSEARMATAPGGYTLFRDASGQAGLIGAVERMHQVGGYWQADPIDRAYGAAAFVQGPSDWDFRWDFVDAVKFSPVGQPCFFNHELPEDPTLVTTGATELAFTSPVGTAALEDATDTWGEGWYAADLAETAVPAGQSFDLEPVLGAGPWPSFGLAEAVQVPPDFEVTSPVMTGAQPAVTPRGISLSWTGSGGDYMVLYVLRQYWIDATGEWANDGVLTCVFPDSGTFTVPLDAWPNWYQGDFLHVQLGRVRTTQQTLPHTNADSRLAGVHWYYGGAVTQ